MLSALSLDSAGVTGQLWDTPGIIGNTPKGIGKHSHCPPASHHLCSQILNPVTMYLPLWAEWSGNVLFADHHVLGVHFRNPMVC